MLDLPNITVALHPYIRGLLVIAAIATWYICRVIVKQLKLFRIREEKTIQNFRKKLFAISLVILAFGLIPIGINIYTLYNDTDRPDTVAFISVVYSAGVHLQPLLLSYVLWRIYRLADEQEELVAILEKKHLAEEAKKRSK